MAGKLAPRTLRMQTKFVKQRASRKVKILRTFQVMRTFIFKKKYKRYGFKLRKKFFRKNNKKNVKIFNKRFRRNNLLRVKQ
jgi:N-acetyl-anhydromuramyl-L-alanine amidase AmpD